MGPGGSNWPAQGAQGSPKRSPLGVQGSKVCAPKRYKCPAAVPDVSQKRFLIGHDGVKNVEKHEIQESSTNLLASFAKFHEMSKET